MSSSLLTLLNRDAKLLFFTRFTRLFAYGLVSVILVFYLVGVGLSERQTGVLLTLTLVGDAIISLFLSTQADRLGRRFMLVIGALLMAAAGLVFAFTRNFIWLLIAGTIGVISPSGNEVGPFLSIEQAALAHVVSAEVRTRVFAWYTLVGSFATALGALAAGLLSQPVQHKTASQLNGYRSVILLYAALGLLLAFVFQQISRRAEVEAAGTPALSGWARWFGIHKSRAVVAKLSALFAMDAFAGGFVLQSFAAYWFYLRYRVNPASLGFIFFWANVFSGVSALAASRLASRIGLVRTMVATHLPSNVLLILVPLMPNLPLAVAVLLARFSISQMDVPTRQSYTMAVVAPEERSAAAGITGVARTIGAALSPALVGILFATPSLVNVPFCIAGLLKIVYDLLLYRAFIALPAPEERHRA